MLILISLEAHIMINRIFKNNFIQRKKFNLKMLKVPQLYHKVNFLILKLSKRHINLLKIILSEELDSKKIIKKLLNCI